MPVNSPDYQIVLIRPEGYIHSDAFMEIAETLLYAFRKLSYQATLAENRFSETGTNILLGANLLGEENIPKIPSNTVIYNLEQLSESSAWMTPTLQKLFANFEVWDYSRRNIEFLKKRGVTGTIRHLPIGYEEELTRIQSPEAQDIDVLFYGSINERRQRIIDELKGAGLQVQTLFGVYGADRDEHIARAKTIINIHYYETSIFELVRVSYLLANKKAVICECSEITEIEDDLRKGVVLTPYDQLIEKCISYIKWDKLRHGLEERGFQCMKDRTQSGYLREIIEKR